MICPKCGKLISDESVYCMYCGKKQAPTAQPANTKTVKIRGNGQGSIYRLPNGTWACQATRYVLGKRKTARKKGFATKKEAQEYLPKLSFDKKKDKRFTIAEAYKAILPSLQKLSDKRLNTYQKAYSRLADIEMCNIADFELNDLQSVIDDIDGGYYSKRYVKDLLSKMFNYAYINGKIERNLVPYITLPENNFGQEKTVYTLDEIKQLWKAWEGGEEFAGYILILLYCGMRTGELWSVKCTDVDFASHTMHGGIKNRKGKFAPIFISREIEPIIRHFTEKGGETLYCGYPTAFYRQWREFKNRFGLRPELQPYSGRHSCVTLLTKAGLPEATIMDITRHTKYDTTLQYTHIDTENILKKINDVMNLKGV